jgi:hypothetical protein
VKLLRSWWVNWAIGPGRCTLVLEQVGVVLQKLVSVVVQERLGVVVQEVVGLLLSTWKVNYSWSWQVYSCAGDGRCSCARVGR